MFPKACAVEASLIDASIPEWNSMCTATCGASTTETGGSSSDNNCANNTDKRKTRVRMKFFRCKNWAPHPVLEGFLHVSKNSESKKTWELAMIKFWYDPCCPKCKLPGVTNNAGTFFIIARQPGFSYLTKFGGCIEGNCVSNLLQKDPLTQLHEQFIWGSEAILWPCR